MNRHLFIAVIVLHASVAIAQESAGRAESLRNTDNAELLLLCEEDQSDRRDAKEKGLSIAFRDLTRLQRLDSIISRGLVVTSQDYECAALLFQHGGTSQHAKKAHEFASQAVRLDPFNRQAARLAAMAWDRYQMRLGLPQWYGTQYTFDAARGWTLYPVDETKVRDEERKALGLRTLEEAKARTREIPPPY